MPPRRAIPPMLRQLGLFAFTILFHFKLQKYGNQNSAVFLTMTSGPFRKFPPLDPFLPWRAGHRALERAPGSPLRRPSPSSGSTVQRPSASPLPRGRLDLFSSPACPATRQAARRRPEDAAATASRCRPVASAWTRFHHGLSPLAPLSPLRDAPHDARGDVFHLQPRGSRLKETRSGITFRIQQFMATEQGLSQ